LKSIKRFIGRKYALLVAFLQLVGTKAVMFYLGVSSSKTVSFDGVKSLVWCRQKAGLTAL
jgi:hypothetical protein